MSEKFHLDLEHVLQVGLDQLVHELHDEMIADGYDDIDVEQIREFVIAFVTNAFLLQTGSKDDMFDFDELMAMLYPERNN